MTLFKTLMAIAVSVLFSIGMVGCEKEGPMEKAGEKVDQAVEDAKDAVTKDGPVERAGEKVDQAVENVKESTK